MAYLRRPSLPAVAIAVALMSAACGSETSNAVDFTTFEWTLVNGDASWERRAGLHVVELNDRFYLMGGRTPLDSPIPVIADIWSDVWASEDEGITWEQILETDGAEHWPPRAYFQTVTLSGSMYVLGGQNAGFDPTFYNDVWSSEDGINWTQKTASAGWEPRAGLRAVTFQNEIYIFAGSQNDDEAITVPGEPPARILFNDVWKSADGTEWVRMTDNAPWEPRAGAVVVAKDGYMILLGGEDGFECASPPDDCPYFNDVWRSRDGATWELVTESAGWSPRPGHQCAVVYDNIVCFGGFGEPQNPKDVWVSPDGATWEQVSDSPWNAVEPEEVKYDFEAIVVGQTIFTFGGDRETFDFTDPTNYLRVDNDVWRYELR